MPTPDNSRDESDMWFWILGWFLTLLTVVGNGLVAFLILKKPQLRTKPNCFIASLAVADILVGLVYLPQIFVKSFTYYSDGCNDAFFITRHYFQYCSITNLCVMLADRYVSIMKPLRHITIITRKRIIFLLVVSWTAPIIVFVVPQTIVILFADKEQDNIFSIFKTLMFNTFPMILLIALTTRVLVVARKLTRESRALNRQVRFNYTNDTIHIKTTSPEIFGKQATAKMMIVVMAIFILCSAAEQWKGFCSCDWTTESCCDIPENVDHLLDLVCIINSAANPIAYSFLKKDLKAHLRRLFHQDRLANTARERMNTLPVSDYKRQNSHRCINKYNVE